MGRSAATGPHCAMAASPRDAPIEVRPTVCIELDDGLEIHHIIETGDTPFSVCKQLLIARSGVSSLELVFPTHDKFHNHRMEGDSNPSSRRIGDFSCSYLTRIRISCSTRLSVSYPHYGSAQSHWRSHDR
jgi:hypothetical protein